MPLIEKRYAEALISLSTQENIVDDIQQELQVVTDLFKSMQDFRLFLLNPEVSINNKKKVIKDSFEGKVKKELINFLLLLIDKSRIINLPGIMLEFTKAADKLKNTLDITVISAIPLEEQQIIKIVEKYKTFYNSANAKVHQEIDKSLIGGVKVKIGDNIVDGSITGRLKALQNILVEK